MNDPAAAIGVIATSTTIAAPRKTIIGGFRTSDRPGHHGVDIMAARGTPIYASAAGTATVVTCNASNGNCDIDGSPSVQGCGWYVDIAHEKTS